MYKKFLVLFLCFILCCTNTIYVDAANNSTQGGSGLTTSQEEDSSLNLDLSMQIQQRNRLDKSKAYTTSQFPLVKTGQQVKTLTDSYGATHSITNKGISTYTSTQNLLSLEYSSSSSSFKDSYLDLIFFVDDGKGNVSSVGAVTWDVYGGNSGNLGAYYDKAYYANKEYVYLALGVYDSESSTSYSDAAFFKVSNPDYASKPQPTGNGNQFVVISNESVDGTKTQSTGTFNVNNAKYSKSEVLPQEAYQMDAVLPFDTTKNIDKLLNKNTRSGVSKAYTIGDIKEFNVANFVTNQYQSLSAKLCYSGSKVNVWVNNNQITNEQANSLGKEFDSKIYGMITTNFGKESDVDKDGKINILCYDIQDGFSGSGGYIAGYFDPQDLYNVNYSNKSEMFYIDTYPTMYSTSTTKDVSKAYSTLAHEFQHMVNFNNAILVEGGKEQMDVWMNEGLSMAAEQIYTGSVLKDRISYYNSSASIKNGHSVLYWDEDGDVLSNYSLSYLFLQYFKIQSGQGDKIFLEMQKLKNNNYKDMESLIKKYIDPNMTFGQFMTNFRIALLLKQNSGLYGFRNVAGFNAINTQTYLGSPTTLRGGGALVKPLTGTGIKVPSNKGTNVTYTVVDKSGKTTNTKPVIKGASNKTIKLGDKFDPKAGVTATDKEDGNLTSKIVITGSVNTKKVGTYKITYSVTDRDKNKVSKTITVKVLKKFKTFSVDSIDKTQKTLTGKGVSGAKVQAYVNGKAVGKSAKVSSKGNFKLTLPKKYAANTKIVIKMSKSGYATVEKTVKVLNTFGTFTVSSITSKTTKITGKGLKGATIKVYVSGKQIGKTVKVSSKGKYTIVIPKQKAGKTVIVKMGKSGYRTVEKKVTVKK